MSRYNWQHRGSAALVGILVILLAVGGTALAGKKKNKDNGWLGVYIHEVDEETQEDWDLATDDGVFVDDVIDGSPAEKAGLQDGDVILTFDGKDVASSNRLTRWIRKTEPDTEVKIKILRDGESQELTVAIGERERDYVYSFSDDDDYYFHVPRVRIPPIPRIDIPRVRIPPIPRIDIPRIDIPRIQVFDDDGEHYYFGSSRGRIGVQLRSLNKQLGKYFGVTDGAGALVEKVMSDSPAEEAGIKAGDVIVAIGDEDVEDVDDAVDEIGDFDDGDEVEITVLRDGEKKTFAVTVEEDEGYSDRRIIVNTPKRLGSRHRTVTWHGDTEDLGDEIREELREAMEELREELEEVREELQETLEELHEGG